MDLDEIEPASSCEPVDRSLPDTADGDLPAHMPGGRDPTPRAGGQGPSGASNVVAAIAAIINSSVITHSVIVTVIVTISVLTAVLALGRVRQ